MSFFSSLQSANSPQKGDTRRARKLHLPGTRIVEYVSQFGDFSIALFEYFLHKADQIFWLMHFLTIKQIELFVNIKFHAVASLIWSGGRVGKRFRYLFVVFFVFGMFLAGGVFQGRLVVEEQQSDLQFLASSSSIILGEASAATFTGESSLLDTPQEHTVEDGETLVSIGQKYGISLESIKFANSLTSNNVRVGQVLKIPPVEGTLHVVRRGDTIESVSRRYGVPSQTIVDFNYLDAPYTLVEGTTITIPDAKSTDAPKNYYAGRSGYDTSAYGVIPYAGGDGPKGTGQFVWPFSGIISQGYNRYHPGIDIAANSGDILAADKGVVVRAGWWQGGYGNAVQVDHRNGFVTTYAHMSVIAVSTGDEVEKGQKLGVVGSTGRSTGPHLHFTVQLDGQYLNPLDQL